MEEVWLKTEPTDEEFDDRFSTKSENGFADTNIGSSPSSTSTNALERIECTPSAEYISLQLLTHNAKRKSERAKVVNESGEESNRPKKQSLICDECGKKFTKIFSLRRHKLLHTGEKPHICSECGAAFALNSSLKSHQLTHKSDSRKFFCEKCGKKFVSKFYLQIHQRSHSGERPFVCSECGEGFTQKQGLARHQLEHTGEKRFECNECGIRFYDNKLLKSHKKTHTDSKSYTCAECGKGFYHKTSLEAHKRAHMTERPFGCDVCFKRFTQMGTLRIHKVIHSDTRPFGCDACEMRFTQKFTLKAHQMKQHGYVPTKSGPKRYKAAMSTGSSAKGTSDEISSPGDCESSAQHSSDNVLKRKSNLPLTELNETKGRTDDNYQPDGTKEIGTVASKFDPDGGNNSARFSEFEEKFATNSSIEVRQFQMPDGINVDRIKKEPPSTDEPFADLTKSERITPTCDNLSESDANTEPLCKEANSNEKSQDTLVDLPHSCDKCERKFALIGSLKNHQRSHRREKFICDKCGKSFAVKHNLKIHKRIHSGIKPYTCEACNMSFTQLSNYNAHKRSHSGVKPFPCHLCDKRFAAKGSLSKHLVSHSNEKAFTCEVCGKKFAHLSTVRKHIKTVHGGEKPYGCDVCKKTFSEKTYLKFHMRSHTGYKPFVCDECPSKFISKSQLTQHKAFSHRAVGVPSPRQRRKMLQMMKILDSTV